MKIIDTHAHMCDQAFGRDMDEVVSRAEAQGVTGIVAVGEDLEDARKNLELSQRYRSILPAAGLFPTRLDAEEADEMLSFIREKSRHLAAIGEVGLDHWKVKDPAGRELQEEIFRRFIRISKELDLPLNCHTRSAGKRAIAVLLEEGASRVQLHAFDGRASSAMPAVEAGFFFSIPPSIVRSRQKQKLARALPLSCILVETDSPVLGPEPGARNEPANARVVIEAVAEIKGIHAREVAEAAFRNTVSLYGQGCLQDMVPRAFPGS